MNCYFANVAGSPPVADLYCEGPLRPADVDWVPPRVDLIAYLSKDSREARVNAELSLFLDVGLNFPEGVASNVTMNWSAQPAPAPRTGGIPMV